MLKFLLPSFLLVAVVLLVYFFGRDFTSLLKTKSRLAAALVIAVLLGIVIAVVGANSPSLRIL